MTASEALEHARSKGVSLSSAGDGRLLWQSPTPVSDDLLGLLTSYKVELLALLESRDDPTVKEASAAVARLLHEAREAGVPAALMSSFERVTRDAIELLAGAVKAGSIERVEGFSGLLGQVSANIRARLAEARFRHSMGLHP